MARRREEDYTYLEARLQDVCDDNVEQFRLEATDAYRAFAPEDRKIIARLKTRTADPYTFFKRWNDTVREQYKALRKTPSRTLVRTLVTTLGISEDAAHEKAVSLQREQTQELYVNCVASVYGQSVAKKQREAVAALLSWEESNIDELHRKYDLFRAYKNIARENRVTVYDPYASFVERMIQRRRIRKENARLLKKETARIAVIDRRLLALYQQDEGRIGRIVATELDIVAIIAARTEYEKALEKLPPLKRRSPAIRSDLYAAVTKALRATYGDKLVGHETSTLAQARHIMADIDEVIVEVFDLSNGQKNILMSDMKTVRGLIKEKELILAKREKRLQVPKRTF